MNMTNAEFLSAIKKGKTRKQGWVEIVAVIHRLKLTNKILDEIYMGLSRFTEQDLKKYVAILNNLEKRN